MLRFIGVGDLALENGGTLPSVTLAFETWGTLNADASNAVLIQHALTGSSHVARGASSEDGWWEDLVGPGKTIDTDRYFVVAANVIGGCYGSTGPSSYAPDGKVWGSRFPSVTVRDSVNVEARLADSLGITRWHAVAGGSLGGARALEWAATYPERLAHCLVVAATAASTAEHIAFAQTQIAAIRMDQHFNNGDYYGGPHPLQGLGLARRIAHITYRSEAELQRRFGRQTQPGEPPEIRDRPQDRGRYRVESYLDHHADKLAARFDANSYVVLTELLMSHDVGRNRGTVQQAFAGSATSFVIAPVDSDRLYFPQQSYDLAAALPGPVEVCTIRTPEGHDGFLTSISQLDAVLRRSIFG
ncbi:homoserine O-acetyltransferase MetX [Arthrobacter roseus]|uniref:homoserine O-acetyltransferase MetX n=1 Tax=Arthrobacter roseus TaxID=136274 RepID=UPI001963BA8D|nr:homoserine O-acetyltransferase [Arthrobacter roseus]